MDTIGPMYVQELQKKQQPAVATPVDTQPEIVTTSAPVAPAAPAKKAAAKKKTV